MFDFFNTKLKSYNPLPLWTTEVPSEPSSIGSYVVSMTSDGDTILTLINGGTRMTLHMTTADTKELIRTLSATLIEETKTPL